MRVEAPEGGAAFGLDQRIASKPVRRPDVSLGRNHIVIAGKHDRALFFEQRGGMRVQPIEPGKLIVELRPRLRIAVGQVDRRGDQAVDLCLEVPAVGIVGIVGQAAQALDRIVATRQDGHAVKAFLPMPDRAVARVADVAFGKGLVAGFQLLKNGDVGLLLAEPFDQTWQARLDAIDVVGRDFH